MAKTKLVTITIDKETGGGFTCDTTGFEGKGCADIHKMFESIGGPGKTDHKPEWNQIQRLNVTAGR